MNKVNEIRIIAPSASAQTFMDSPKYVRRFQEAQKVLSQFCNLLSFSKNAFEINKNNSSLITSRIDDLHSAFEDKNVDAIFCARGGYNCNELLQYIDWDIIRHNPKVFMGFSDITVLCNAIYQMCGIPTFLGYNFIDYGRDSLSPRVISNTKNIMEYKTVDVSSEDAIIVNHGDAEGICIGGNLSSFMLLKGTQYMPRVQDAVLLLESDSYLAGDADKFFIRNLYSLLQDDLLKNIRGIIIGQFEEEDHINLSKFKQDIQSIAELKNIPIIANIRFSHKYPSEVFKIGSKIKFRAAVDNINIGF